jgi:hypothetical protein
MQQEGEGERTARIAPRGKLLCSARRCPRTFGRYEPLSSTGSALKRGRDDRIRSADLVMAQPDKPCHAVGHP